MRMMLFAALWPIVLHGCDSPPASEPSMVFKMRGPQRIDIPALDFVTRQTFTPSKTFWQKPAPVRLGLFWPDTVEVTELGPLITAQTFAEVMDAMALRGGVTFEIAEGEVFTALGGWKRLDSDDWYGTATLFLYLDLDGSETVALTRLGEGDYAGGLLGEPVIGIAESHPLILTSTGWTFRRA